MQHAKETKLERAYQKLASLTAEYTAVNEISVNWTKLSSLAKRQANELKRCNAASDTVDWVAQFGAICNERAERLEKWLNDRSAEMSVLNDAIQNGVYNDETI